MIRQKAVLTKAQFQACTQHYGKVNSEPVTNGDQVYAPRTLRYVTFAGRLVQPKQIMSRHDAEEWAAQGVTGKYYGEQRYQPLEQPAAEDAPAFDFIELTFNDQE